MGKKVWEFPQVTEIDDNLLLLGALGEKTKTLPGSLINAINERVNTIITGQSETKDTELVDCRTLASGLAYAAAGDAIRAIWNKLTAVETATYTTDNNDFTGGVVDYGVVTVVKKAGWCIVHGSIAPTDYVGSEWVEVLPPTVVPDTQHNSGVYTTAHYWGATYNQPLRVGVRGDGSLIIAYGSANKYTFAITYPIE